MATTYSAYYNLNADSSLNNSRNPSAASSTDRKRSVGDKISDLLAPRWPIYPALTPTSVANAAKREAAANKETSSRTGSVVGASHAPVRMYDSVLRRPLFHKAKKGNEVTIAERRMSEDSSL
jgi:hypothetical protein